MSQKKREKLDFPFATDTEVLEMVALFEACQLPYPRWTHRAHLGVALCYLRQYSFEVALERVRYHIPLYNRTCGDPDGYHETITILFLKRLKQYLHEVAEPATLGASIEVLVSVCNMQWPLHYYSPERLWSAEAKLTWVEPDRQPLDF